MNRTDRMLAIVLELQSRSRLRAEDLAATFETSVRTIYRDMQALSEAGVPIIGSPGQGYSLAEGYFLPPVSFTAEEAVTLLLGLDFVDQQFDEDYQARALDARRKIEAVIHEKVKEEADRTRSGMRLLTTRSQALMLETLHLLRRAVHERRNVRFMYTKSGGRERTTRSVNPYGLLFRDGTWMLVGYCHLRREMRYFLLRRMSSVELLPERFQMPADFDLQRYNPPDLRKIVVRLSVQPDLIPMIQEYDHQAVEKVEEAEEEERIVTLRVRQQEEILPWVLSLGSGVKVLEPDSLRLQIHNELIKMIQRY